MTFSVLLMDFKLFCVNSKLKELRERYQYAHFVIKKLLNWKIWKLTNLIEYLVTYAQIKYVSILCFIMKYLNVELVKKEVDMY